MPAGPHRRNVRIPCSARPTEAPDRDVGAFPLCAAGGGRSRRMVGAWRPRAGPQENADRSDDLSAVADDGVPVANTGDNYLPAQSVRVEITKRTAQMVKYWVPENSPGYAMPGPEYRGKRGAWRRVGGGRFMRWREPRSRRPLNGWCRRNGWFCYRRCICRKACSSGGAPLPRMSRRHTRSRFRPSPRY